jgi:uncharacterized ferritin-like protein (DUF455 family)
MYLGLSKLADALHELRFFERATAHVLMGWCVKIPELEIKLAAARHAFAAMTAAAQLGKHIGALAGGDPSPAGTPARPVPVGWRSVLHRIDACAGASELMAGLYGVVKPNLATRYRALALDPILDAELEPLVRAAIARLDNESAWGARFAETRAAFRHDIEALWNARNTSIEKIDGEVVWRPLDRVPHAVRPEAWDCGIPGELRPVPADAINDPRDNAILLHNNINGEVTTLELVLRCSYEHPDMPEAFHLGLARHASDEARHTIALDRLLAKLGLRYGDLPTYTTSYDTLYEYAPCPAGSRQELLWRLLLRTTLQEAFSLEDLAFQSRLRAHFEQDEIARVFDYLLADEVFHVQNGLRWCRWLCDEDATRTAQERERAHAYYNETMRQRRETYVRTHPQRVMAEHAWIEELKQRVPLDVPFQETINVDARRRAGFTQAEIQQVLEWGYARMPEDS